MLRKTDINGKFMQVAWWALATIAFPLIVAMIWTHLSQNPFLESLRIATYMREHTAPGDTIPVLGSEAGSDRHSATGCIYTYGLMEPQKYAQQMQQEMIREIEAGRPKYLISVAVLYSWLRRPESEQPIFTWANEYMTENYAAAGLVNIRSTGTDYFFGDIPPTVEALKDYILIYRRNL